jgi:hypothetical protein
MPIRFRCAYCNQLMGIGRRKAGTIIRCPRCAGEVIVPAEQPLPAGTGRPGLNPLFEQDDFARELADVEPIPDPPANPLAPTGSSHPPLGGLESNDPEAIGEPAHGLRRPGLFLPTPLLILAIGILLGVLGVAFSVGFMVGRSTAP